MAKFKYGQNLDTALDDFGTLELKVSANGQKATWVDVETGAKIVVFGKNLEASEDNENLLGGGKITSAELTDGDKKLVVDITDLDIKATKLMAAYEEGGPEQLAYFFLTKGDDVVIGSKHGDLLISGGGDDVLTGKAGSDQFDFQLYKQQDQAKVQPEHDIITDFDTKGEDADMLAIRQEFDYAGANKGKDTLLTFADDSTLLLEDVTRKEFKTYWETMVE